MKKKRVYVDTSVFGGVRDEEFERASLIFFDLVRKGEFIIVIAPVVIDEISMAPREIQNLFRELSPYTEVIEITDEMLDLRDAYLRKKIVSKQFSNDALHVAAATVSECSVIVSWNFNHIVNFEKIVLYNAVNLLNGYKQIAIHSPMEVIKYE
jgi:predicted nucleic acid-binding protein